MPCYTELARSANKMLTSLVILYFEINNAFLTVAKFFSLDAYVVNC